MSITLNSSLFEHIWVRAGWFVYPCSGLWFFVFRYFLPTTLSVRSSWRRSNVLAARPTPRCSSTRPTTTKGFAGNPTCPDCARTTAGTSTTPAEVTYQVRLLPKCHSQHQPHPPAGPDDITEERAPPTASDQAEMTVSHRAPPLKSERISYVGKVSDAGGRTK